ncbi:MAG: hypothetical protein K2X66_09355 [Cyanobacteria bacterium]|nr:hypothetical protein [Cyanobacteriota bacterium]
MIFQGDKERRANYAWLNSFPEKSKKKLSAINRAGYSPHFPATVSHNVKHIVMALRASLIDSSIRSLVRTLVGTRQKLHGVKRELARLEKRFHPEKETLNALQKALEKERRVQEEALQDLHIAIDWVCGECPPFQIPPHRQPLVEETHPLNALKEKS